MCLEMGSPLRRGERFVFICRRHICCIVISHDCTCTHAVSRAFVYFMDTIHELQLELTASQFVLGPSPLRLKTSNFFQLNPCGHSPYVTSSLTKGWVCRLQLLLVFASAVILGSESSGTHNQILLSQIRDSPNLEGLVPVFMSPMEQGGPVVPPSTGFPFSSPPTTRRATVEVFEPASTLATIHELLIRPHYITSARIV
jgi:hypothetical protein